MTGGVGVEVKSSCRFGRVVLRELTFHVTIDVGLLEKELGLGIGNGGWEGGGGGVYAGMDSWHLKASFRRDGRRYGNCL
jgi:hypothetical protein